MSLPSYRSNDSHAGFDVLVGTRRVHRKPPRSAGFLSRLGLAGLLAALIVDAAIAYRLWCNVSARVPREWPGSWVYDVAGWAIEPFRTFDTVQPVKETGFLDFPGLIAMEFYFAAGLAFAIACFALRGLSVVLARSQTFRRGVALPIGDALAWGATPLSGALRRAGHVLQARIIRLLERLLAGSEPLIVEAESLLEAGRRHMRRRVRVLRMRAGASLAAAAVEARAVLARQDAASPLRLAMERLRQARSWSAFTKAVALERYYPLFEGWRRRLTEAEEQGWQGVTRALEAAESAGRTYAEGVRRDGRMLRRRGWELARGASAQAERLREVAWRLARAYWGGVQRDWRTLSQQAVAFRCWSATGLCELVQQLERQGRALARGIPAKAPPAARRLEGRLQHRCSTFALAGEVQQEAGTGHRLLLPADLDRGATQPVPSNGDVRVAEEAAISRRDLLLLEWPAAARDCQPHAEERRSELPQLVRSLQERASLVVDRANGNGHGQKTGGEETKTRRQRRKQPLRE